MSTLLKNGLIYDGTGSAPVTGDVLLEGDRIAAVGVCPQEADRIIDCTGLCITPGWIDGHSHNDMFYNYEDAAKYYRPFLEQGITTQVTGNCGFSVFGVPDGSPNAQYVGAGLFKGIDAGSFAEFKKKAPGHLYVNMAPLVGHGTARIGVTGMSASPMRPDQIRAETALVEEAMQGGAIGGSFGFMYEPGMYAKEDELVAFASAVAKYDGIVTVHPRAESVISMDYSLLQRTPHIELALDEVIRIMEQSHCRMEYSHMIYVGEKTWPSLDRVLQKFADARAKGYDLAYDNYSMFYGASVITVICPAWYMALSEEQKHSPVNRLKLRIMIDISRKALGIDYSDLRIAYINDEPKYRAYEGRSVAEIAKQEKRDCLDLYLELVDASKGAGRIYLGKYLNDTILRRMMEDELSVFITDAWVEAVGEQNRATFQGYPEFLVKAKEFGIPAEKIIRKMTGAVADRFRLQNRGYLRPGMKADVTVYDPALIRTYPDEPGRRADGICSVFVNGQQVVNEGNWTPETCGELILRTTGLKTGTK